MEQTSTAANLHQAGHADSKPDHVAPADCLKTLEAQLAEVEDLTFAIKKMVVKNADTLAQEGIRSQIETLERWTESYRRGLSAANKMSHIGLTWMTELRDHLKLAADEILRLEAEGGAPVTPEQAEKADALLKAIRSLDRLIPTAEQVFHSMPEEGGDAHDHHQAATGDATERQAIHT